MYINYYKKNRGDLLSKRPSGQGDRRKRFSFPVVPMIHSPRQGEVLNKARPVIAGMARPGNTMVICVDDYCDYVTSNIYGCWRIESCPLTAGYHKIALRYANMEEDSAAVVFCVAPPALPEPLEPVENAAINPKAADPPDVTAGQTPPEAPEITPMCTEPSPQPEKAVNRICEMESSDIADPFGEDSTLRAGPDPFGDREYIPAEFRDRKQKEIFHEQKRLPGRGLYNYRKWWERREVDIFVCGKLLSGIPIFTNADTLRVVNRDYSYFIPLEKVDYIRTPDGLNMSPYFDGNA